MKPSDHQTIATYNLFGEAGDLPDVVHCETIEARSRLHDWEFAPHRHARLHQVLYIQNGQGHASLDGKRCELTPSTFVNVPTGVVHGFTFDNGTQGQVITLATESLDETLHSAEGLTAFLNRPFSRPATPDISQTVAQIATVFASRPFARAQILRASCALLLGYIAQAAFHADISGNPIAKPALLARFEALIEQHFLDQWSVSDYANALAVTSTHLSRITKSATGRPASHLIEERIVREARRNLVYTNLPVSTIAYSLGYEDPAYFSRVFSRATGLSPRDFRQRAMSKR
ncbi:helix-turn-helix domain-containing protein [Shimia abyssi]|nr:helix-turn-helix domain-containing protein [Shimia abyssi]